VLMRSVCDNWDLSAEASRVFSGELEFFVLFRRDCGAFSGGRFKPRW
jgi:hypothetical protein